MDPKPVTMTTVGASSYSGPEPQPFVAVGGVPGTLVEDPDRPGTFIIVSEV